MAPASSSALRVDDSAYGSLEGLGMPRRKKVPVLVLDPEELERAHQLFQEGAAEQLGDFDPQERANRPIPLFGLAPIGAEPLDSVPVQATAAAADTSEGAEENDESALDAGLPSPEELLARSLEQDALDDAQAEAEAAQASAVADTLLLPAVVPINWNSLSAAEARAEDGAPTEPDAPNIAAREPALPDAVSPEHEQDRVAGIAAEPLELELDFEEIVELAEDAHPAADVDDGTFVALNEPPFVVQSEADQAEAARFESAEAESRPDLSPLDPAADSVASFAQPGDEPDDDDGIEALRATPNSLRARLVREDVCLARPEPTGWNKLKANLRHWWSGVFG